MFANRKADGAHISSVGNEAEKSAFGASPTARAAASGNYRAAGPSPHSMVDEFLTMKGDLESEGDIHVKGKVLGNIKCKLLIIEVDALVEGGVDAEEVIVRGNAKGTIQADRVRLEKTANVDSEIRHSSFSAEEGARIKGSLRSKDDPAGADTEPVATVRSQGLTRAKEGIASTMEASKSDAA